MSPPKIEPEPRERQETVRQALRRHLAEGEPLTAHDLSALLSVSERQIAGHLEHLRRSLQHTSQQLHVVPASCQDCGFRYTERQRLDRPSSCPKCRSEWIAPPAFHL